MVWTGETQEVGLNVATWGWWTQESHVIILGGLRSLLKKIAVDGGWWIIESITLEYGLYV